MTVLIGVLCSDGVVIGADSAVTAGFIERPFDQKIQISAEGVIVATTGDIGFGQRFTAAVTRAWQKLSPSLPMPIDIGKALSVEGLTDFLSTGLTIGNFESGALVAFPYQGRPCLCHFGYKNLQPTFMTPDFWYVAMGSGQLIADPFLALMRRVFWRTGPPVYQDAVFTVTWALEHAIEVNTGGIGGMPRIAVLASQSGRQLQARMLTNDEIAEHRQNVQNAEAYLREYENILRGRSGAPDIPKP